RSPRTTWRSVLLARGQGVVVASLAAPTVARADDLLTGTITSASGEKLGGVTVSAKQEGTTISTHVYTDETGNYYFPPLPAGKYRVWAQALSFEIARGEVDLSATRRQDLALKPITEQEQIIRQAPSGVLVGCLPEETEADARIKKVFTNQCTGCHSPGYTLQFKFDEAGWNKIINLMKVIQGGAAVPANPRPNVLIEHSQKELAAYLA